eukprot:TRINITY_DN4350_c0_g2_i1.p1 TRINITY_DN4350_c0_g2~~TRINITY_DN4350_c0_g2_i1.p1  ORF type:complete len:207 (+),score=46.17 TRINITY_DN4350_c0_g2_i1:83-622(+)
MYASAPTQQMQYATQQQYATHQQQYAPQQQQQQYAVQQQYAPQQQFASQQQFLPQFQPVTPSVQTYQQPPAMGSAYAVPVATTPAAAPVAQQPTGIPSSVSMIAYQQPSTADYPASSAMSGPFKFTAEPQGTAGTNTMQFGQAPVAQQQVPPPPSNTTEVMTQGRVTTKRKVNKKKGCC